jgi:DNA-binding NtrC family response regulator
LRERPDDSPALVAHFSAQHRARTGRRPPQWTDGALALLAQYRWPGNVRELANIVERLAILYAGADVDERNVRAVLPMDGGARRVDAPLPDPVLLESSLTDTLDGHERTLIVRALSAAGGNVAEASRRLKTDRANLYRRMRRLGIPVGDE